ncbi:MAG: hypothetical protein COW59_12550 [Lysobacterales bacterium CG17_big_fil_post_rev_8_21_14_2_50_64_11]|nr:MAG: hypothetical protein COW59_12550 [Xanthomonadales bacterium CG17_big_fil_post_rev_8_21_14_2_50_64_11]PIX60851.1 MAG: hypothetical protein COZ47_05170 [Xanthomonadales bacterium CG_4_10_14_3_um_filter_64_11]
MQTRSFLIVLLVALAWQPKPSQAAQAPRDMLLIGGGMRICAAASVRDCAETFAGFSPAQTPQIRFHFDETGVATATDPALWSSSPAAIAALAGPILRAVASEQVATLDEDDAIAAITNVCLPVAGSACNDGTAAHGALWWDKLLERERQGVLAALQVPDIDGAGVRRREGVNVHASRNPNAAQMLERFVALARRNGTARPRIAVVTAASADPFAVVDFYLEVFRQLGAEPVWWPLDAALAGVIEHGESCDRLETVRRAEMALPGRERVYPDLAVQQMEQCLARANLAQWPTQVDGVFFSGGDQSRLRTVFFTRDGKPNGIHRALATSFAAGSLVIAGTSAGSAVQSSRAMLSNGESRWALAHQAISGRAPEPGCTRAGRCGVGIPESALTYDAAGGLGLVPEAIIFDTHFSERGRELRLLAMLHDAAVSNGIGIDENSAVHLRWQAGTDTLVEALGASGAWLLRRASAGGDDGYLWVDAHYLATGSSAYLGSRGWRLDGDHRPVRRARLSAPADVLDAGAMRRFAWDFAAHGRRQSTFFNSVACGRATIKVMHSERTAAFAPLPPATHGSVAGVRIGLNRSQCE